MGRSSEAADVLWVLSLTPQEWALSSSSTSDLTPAECSDSGFTSLQLRANPSPYASSRRTILYHQFLSLSPNWNQLRDQPKNR